MTRTLSIAAVLVMLILGRPAVSAANPGEEVGMSLAAAAMNLFYTPAKVVMAAVGLPVGAVAGLLNGGDTRSAYAVWVPTTSGTYFLTPYNLEGREPIEFFGSDYADTPSVVTEDDSGIYDIQ